MIYSLYSEKQLIAAIEERDERIEEMKRNSGWVVYEKMADELEQERELRLIVQENNGFLIEEINLIRS